MLHVTISTTIKMKAVLLFSIISPHVKKKEKIIQKKKGIPTKNQPIGTNQLEET